MLMIAAVILPYLSIAWPIAGYAQPQRNLIEFYQAVDSMTLFPPVDRELTVLCEKEVDRRFVTFVGLKGDSGVLLAAVTLAPIADLQKSISLTVDFNGVSPNPGKISTWGYVFDRNGDGKIDYLALVGGAAAFEPDDFPEDFPVKDKRMNRKQVDYFVRNCRIVFNHWADDNFDGTLDGVVHINLDPEREWVKDHFVIRSTKFNGKFDDVWKFHEMINDRGGTVKHTATGVPYHPIGQLNDVISPGTFAENTDILKLMNQAAKLCGLTMGSFQRAPRRW